MSTEVDLKDVELNEVDQEKQPMTGGDTGNGDASSPTVTEKNGMVSLTIPKDQESKFTGLSKDELIQVAGTPGWVRTRWALLILFWLGWLGMLAGAIGIIIQAPRCKPLPEMNWWNQGPMYEIGDVAAFSNDLEGLKGKVDSLSQLKVKGLVVGPIHKAPTDDIAELDLNSMAVSGDLVPFKALLEAAHKKSMKVVLDLTPNYQGQQRWFDNLMGAAEKLKVALVHWQKQGVDGFKLSGFERVFSLNSTLWDDIRTIALQPQEDKEGKEKERSALFGVTEKTSAEEVGTLLNSSGVDLLLSGVLRAANTNQSGQLLADAVEKLYGTLNQTKLAWGISDREQGHLATLLGSSGSGPVKFYQTLLFTLPGTPIFNYGDEIGLEDTASSKSPKMVWYSDEDAEKLNGTDKAEMEERLSVRKVFKALSELRSKERSLLHGDYIPLASSGSTLAYLRSWDQSDRYTAVFNWGPDEATFNLKHEQLPPQAKVCVSTDSTLSDMVDLQGLKLAAGQAVLLKTPYLG
ncbi:solute carrier family 3 member 2b [Engraulis encrasicolus]|uniref:solute carrier family 3 member 2b n=1 Tax=Engraulis encrasicolus TaxID=184585 RepID=UPI002FD31E83